jgi:hypothetical protein
MNTATAKAEIVGQPVVRLTIELPPTHAAELAGLLAGHVNFLNFPWAQSIYEALDCAGIQEEYVFTDSEHGPDIFLVRKQGKANGRRGTSRDRTRNDECIPGY